MTYVMESSGPYHLQLAIRLTEAGANVRIADAFKVRKFIEMNGERHKTDRKDAQWLFRYGIERNSGSSVLPDKFSAETRQLIALSELFMKQRTMIINQLRSLEVHPFSSDECQDTLKEMSVLLSKKIKQVNISLRDQLQSKFPIEMRSISSVPGLGPKASMSLITYTNGFEGMDNYRRLIAFAGLAPRAYSSGSSVRKKKGICKRGSSRLRNVLFMCSLSAIRHNGPCKELYERLRGNGKPGKVALIAVCNKLLKQAFSVAKKGELYDPQYASSRSKTPLVVQDVTKV